MTDWITVARVDGVVEADLARMRLEGAGISVVVRDANMIRMDPILSNVFGGVRVDVPVEQEEQAREILGVLGTDAPDDVAADSVASERCPVCGSSDLEPVSRNRLKRFVAAILTVLAGGGGVPRAVTNELRCRQCDRPEPSAPSGAA